MGDRGFPSPPTLSTVELRLLGKVSARVEPGREAAAVLTQPKRVALLGYLAAAGPRGFHRRDAILALFWPEADQEHARTSLRKSVHFLRQQLGPDIIVSRGDEEIGLDLDRCWCDVVTFEESVEAGWWERASELYQGDLLPGLHLSDVPEFERWLEETRIRLRAQAVRAAWKLSERECAQNRVSGGVQWARRAIELAPYDEDGIRRLLGLLLEAGDRVGAVLAYEQFAQRLSADLELQPSADTVALIESARNQKNTPVQTRPRFPARRLSRTAPDTTRGEGSEVAEPARFERAVRHRPRSVLAILVTLGIAVAIGAFVWRYRSGPDAPYSPGAIAVLPFVYRGSPELSYLGDGLMELLSVKLEGATGLRPVDPRALLTFANREGSVADPQRAALVAQRFGARNFVFGSITEAGGRLGVSATVYDSGGHRRNSIEAIAGSKEEIFDLADRLARHILAEMQDRPRDLVRVAGQTTSSLPAFKAYLEGERECWAGRQDRAIEAYQRAVEIDTAFALAYYRLAALNNYSPQARETVDRAIRHSDRLSERHRGLVLALAAWLRGDHRAADQQYHAILAAHPDDTEAWFMLGQFTIHKASLLGRAWVDAREAFERVLALDPGNLPSVFWLAAIAAREGRPADLDSLTDRLLRLDPHPDLAGIARAQRAIALGNMTGEARFVADLRTRPDPMAQVGSGLVTWTTGNLAAGRRLWRLITEPSRSVGMRLRARVVLAKIELTNGRWRAAQAELEAAETMDAGAALEHRAYYALTRFLSVPDSELIALRDSLRRWDPSAAVEEGDGLLEDHRGLHRYLRLYLLGLLSARLHDEPAARRYVAELERVDRSSPAGRFAADEAQAIRSELASISGRQQEALTLLEGARFWINSSGLEGSSDSPFTTHFHERFARAELLNELGRDDEALPWYRSLAYDLLYTGPAELRMAQIYEHKGNRRRAIEHYTRFIELWRECDPELQPLVQHARDALTRLR